MRLNVVVNYHSNADAARETSAAIEAKGGKALIVQADVGSAEDREAMVQQTLDRFGRLDVLVNNAGVAPKVRADLLEMGEESWDWVLDKNLKGPFFLSQRVAKHWVEQGSVDESPGRMIVNVGSISAYTASINRGEYCVSKAGMAMMTKLFAHRLAEVGTRGIPVYEIRPGVIATDMTDAVQAKYDALIIEAERPITLMRRWGQPDDIAKAVGALVRGDFPYSTGEVINVDGGFHVEVL